MAMKARYTTLDGEIIAQNRSGARHLYVPDPLGSTIALINSSQTITDTWVYWPYGEVKTRTGSTVTPFQFVGTQGYYQDSTSKTYVRARYLDTQKGRWVTQDPIGRRRMEGNLYSYVLNSPQSLSDPLGLWTHSCWSCLFLGPALMQLCLLTCRKRRTGQPAGGNGLPVITNCYPWEAAKILNSWVSMCSSAKKLDDCFEQKCFGVGTNDDDCIAGLCQSPPRISCDDDWVACSRNACSGFANGVIYICPDFFDNQARCGYPLVCQLIHEAMHACGSFGHFSEECFSCAGAALPDCSGMKA